VGRRCFDVQSLDKNLKRKPTEMMAVFVTTWLLHNFILGRFSGLVRKTLRVRNTKKIIKKSQKIYKFKKNKIQKITKISVKIFSKKFFYHLILTSPTKKHLQHFYFLLTILLRDLCILRLRIEKSVTISTHWRCFFRNIYPLSPFCWLQGGEWGTLA
jgi:hypothetical protein